MDPWLRVCVTMYECITQEYKCVSLYREFGCLYEHCVWHEWLYVCTFGRMYAYMLVYTYAHTYAFSVGMLRLSDMTDKLLAYNICEMYSDITRSTWNLAYNSLPCKTTNRQICTYVIKGVSWVRPERNEWNMVWEKCNPWYIDKRTEKRSFIRTRPK